jgi:hypothetical protein
MNCREIQERLTDFIYAELSEEETVAVVRHLAHCQTCALEESDLRRTKHLLAHWPDREMSPDLANRLRAAARPSLEALQHESRPLTWGDRWAALLEALRTALPRTAPVAYSTATTVLAALSLVGLKVTFVSEPQTMLFCGILWAGAWNGLFRLAWNGDSHKPSPPRKEDKPMLERLQIDVRTTVYAGILACALVGVMCLVALWLPVPDLNRPLAVWLVDLFQRFPALYHPHYLEGLIFSLGGIVAVGAAVPLVARFARIRSLGAGRVSGTLAALLYTAIQAPALYVANERLDAVWLFAAVATLVFAVIGGLFGDALANRRAQRA